MKKEEKDESLFDLTDDESSKEGSAFFEDDDDDDKGFFLDKAVELNEKKNEIVEAQSSNTIKNAGIVAIIGIIGYFIAQKFKKDGGSPNQTDSVETNFKPVDFGF